MARSTQMMIPAFLFFLAALAADGFPPYISAVSAAIGLIFIITGCAFWMIDGE